MKPRTGKFSASLARKFEEAAAGSFPRDQKMSIIIRASRNFKAPDDLDIESGADCTVIIANASLDDIEKLEKNRGVLSIELPQPMNPSDPFRALD